MAQLIEGIEAARETGDFGIYQGRSVAQLTREVVSVANTLNHLRDVSQSDSFEGSNPYDLKDTLNREKNGILMELLSKRAQSQNSGIIITLHKFPGEQLHPFSQNSIEFNFTLPVTDNLKIHSELNRVGSGREQDSIQVANLIGKPDKTQAISAGSYLLKTYEEIRKVEKAFSLAHRNGDTQAWEYLAYLKYQLVENILLTRATLPAKEAMDAVMIGISPRHDRILLQFPKRNLIIIPKISRLKQLVKDGGGYDYYYRDSRGQSLTVNSERTGIVAPDDILRQQSEE
jgi:hypothetical protein